ncbi:hypothetical protein ACJX0J_021454, partial [Zea mays]
ASVNIAILIMFRGIIRTPWNLKGGGRLGSDSKVKAAEEINMKKEGPNKLMKEMNTKKADPGEAASKSKDDDIGKTSVIPKEITAIEKAISHIAVNVRALTLKQLKNFLASLDGEENDFFKDRRAKKLEKNKICEDEVELLATEELEEFDDQENKYL